MIICSHLLDVVGCCDWFEIINGWFLDKKGYQIEDMEESKMTEDIYNTCRKGPLRELKEKINSSNINSKAPSSYPYVWWSIDWMIFLILVWKSSSSLCYWLFLWLGRWTIGGCFVFIGRRSRSECSKWSKINFMISFQLMIFEIEWMDSFILCLESTWDI